MFLYVCKQTSRISKVHISRKKERCYNVQSTWYYFLYEDECIERFWVLLNQAPSSTQLHPPPPSSFQTPPSFLQHPQQYLHQNVACNWAISPNLGQKIKSRPFWLKIGTHGILEVLIPNPDLNFWNSHPKIHFWASLGPKCQSCPFCLKIGAQSISRMLILIPTLVFWISNFEFLFGQIWAKNVKVVYFV